MAGENSMVSSQKGPTDEQRKILSDLGLSIEDKAKIANTTFL